jgi:hypothetical protein
MISETLQKSVLQRYDEARRKTKKKHSFFPRIRFIMYCHLSFVTFTRFPLKTKGFREFFLSVVLFGDAKLQNFPLISAMNGKVTTQHPIVHE